MIEMPPKILNWIHRSYLDEVKTMTAPLRHWQLGYAFLSILRARLKYTGNERVPGFGLAPATHFSGKENHVGVYYDGAGGAADNILLRDPKWHFETLQLRICEGVFKARVHSYNNWASVIYDDREA